MSQKAIQGNLKVAEKIKQRRKELNLTIEEASKRAGVGTKTWCRYEAGESIRHDKYKGVCKALNWMQLPMEDDKENGKINIADYKDHEAWSTFLEKNYGEFAALSFAIGSDILLDYINEDVKELSSLPSRTHIGQLGTSFLVDILPEQFIMCYDYEFLYAMQCKLRQLRGMAHFGGKIIAHSVLEELILQLVVDEAEFLIENNYSSAIDNRWKDWIYDIFDDMDIVTCLFSNIYLTPDHCYHFSHWLEDQFYCE